MDDYMSDAFLRELEEQEMKEKRKKKTTVRKAKPKQLIPKKKEYEQKQRDEGLHQPISAESKGFKLLAKMGYKEGGALGKTNKGMETPIGLSLKRGREGIGVQEAREREEEEQVKKKLKEREEVNDAFHNTQRYRYNDRKIKGQLCALLKVCESLDQQHGVSENSLLTISVPETKDDEFGEAAEGKSHSADSWKAITLLEYFQEGGLLPLEVKVARLMEILGYVRHNYLYCLYCAIKYDDEEDMARNCPGETEEAHED